MGLRGGCGDKGGRVLFVIPLRDEYLGGAGGGSERELGVTKNGAVDPEMTDAAKVKIQQFIRGKTYLVQMVDQLAIVLSRPCTNYPQGMKV